MAGCLTVQERAQIAAHYEVWNSAVAVQRWWRTMKGRNASIRHETIKNFYSKLLTTGSVTDARRSGRPSTSQSVENDALVRDMFTHSRRKSTRQAARESGLAKAEVYRAKPRKMEQLGDRIRNVITKVPHDFLQKTVDSIPGRLRKLVDAAGAYIEF
jgi:hypothetical protein